MISLRKIVMGITVCFFQYLTKRCIFHYFQRWVVKSCAIFAQDVIYFTIFWLIIKRYIWTQSRKLKDTSWVLSASFIPFAVLPADTCKQPKAGLKVLPDQQTLGKMHFLSLIENLIFVRNCLWSLMNKLIIACRLF
jgi:hypothetical protein